MRLDAKEIKTRIDLIEYLASLGIELKPVGAGGEYRGLCPFHDDAAPSFQVNRRKGLWHCFGCSAGGDVISFVMKHEGVGFREALDTLAGPAGLREPVRSEDTDRGCIFCAAADYWHKCLGGSASARSYLERRCIGSPEIVERCGIGFAPGRTRTRDWLLTKGFTLPEIEAAGLVNRRGLDSFFGRVTFPLVEDGNAVNVYGRSLSDNYRHMYLPARCSGWASCGQQSRASATWNPEVDERLAMLAGDGFGWQRYVGRVVVGRVADSNPAPRQLGTRM